MPIFLDHALRKALLAKIKDSFGQDEVLSGQVRVLEQESFLPESANQVLLTDLQVANDSLDASNRVTDLYGTVTFSPLKKSETTFLFWAQENTHQDQLFDQGFYHLRLNKVADTDLPDQGWVLSAEAIPRITESRKPWVGLRISLDKALAISPEELTPSNLKVSQQFEDLIPGDDFTVIGSDIFLRRYVTDTKILFKGLDITKQCYYWDLVSQVLTLRNINPPIQLPSTAVLGTVSAYNLTYKHPLVGGFSVSQRGILAWKHPVKPGVKLLLQYYNLKPVFNGDLPSEFKIQLEHDPLVYADGSTALVVMSNLRGVLTSPVIEVVGTELRILEPIPNEAISIDYRYHLKSFPPAEVHPSTINDEILPGICLTFTDNFIDGDEVVVIKHEARKSTGIEHGGNTSVELSLKLRSADDSILTRMTSRIFFLFTDQDTLLELSNQGISLENNVSYSRSYEDRDGNSEKWLINTFRLKIHHTWRYLVPHVVDLNSMTLSIGSIVQPTETGAPTFKELLYHSTEPHWLQPY